MDTLSLILDAVLVIIFVATVLEGRRKGFTVTVLSFAVSIISLIIAKEYAQPLAVWLNENFVHDGLVKELTELINTNLSNGTQSVIASLPDYVVNAAESAGISLEGLVGQLASEASVGNAAAEMVTAAEKIIILPLITVVSFLVIFALGKAILGFGARVVGLAAKLPVIRSIDKTLGALAGALRGVLTLAVVSLILSAVASVFADNELSKAVTDTVLLSKISDTVQSILFN